MICVNCNKEHSEHFDVCFSCYVQELCDGKRHWASLLIEELGLD